MTSNAMTDSWNRTHILETSLKACIFIVAILIASSIAGATVDIVSPSENEHTNQTQIIFEYFVNSLNATNCQLVIDSSSVQTDIDITEGFNSFTHTLSIGRHEWKVTCTDGTLTQESSARNITIDQGAPTIVLFTPQDNEVIRSTNLSISFVTLDAYACSTTKLTTQQQPKTARP
jgi:hypothetical protein